MRLILNVIWLVFGGLWLALGYLLASLVCFLLIITIPFGFAALRIASYALWPFGRTIVEKPTAGTGALIGNVIWVLLFGIWLALGHLVSAAAMAVTIIGIPLALANLKLIPVSLVTPSRVTAMCISLASSSGRSSCSPGSHLSPRSGMQ